MECRHSDLITFREWAQHESTGRGSVDYETVTNAYPEPLAFSALGAYREWLAWVDPPGLLVAEADVSEPLLHRPERSDKTSGRWPFTRRAPRSILYLPSGHPGFGDGPAAAVALFAELLRLAIDPDEQAGHLTPENIRMRAQRHRQNWAKHGRFL